jgi:hypothetical protein
MEHGRRFAVLFQGRGTRRSREGVDALTVAVPAQVRVQRRRDPWAASGTVDADFCPGSHARGLLVVQTAREIDEVVGHANVSTVLVSEKLKLPSTSEVAAHDHPVAHADGGVPARRQGHLESASTSTDAATMVTVVSVARDGVEDVRPIAQRQGGSSDLTAVPSAASAVMSRACMSEVVTATPRTKRPSLLRPFA